MENRKVLSVVMPAYNMEAYLARSVQSVTAAGVMDAVEIIIVNDGSTDRTLEIANSIQAQYLTKRTGTTALPSMPRLKQHEESISRPWTATTGIIQRTSLTMCKLCLTVTRT